MRSHILTIFIAMLLIPIGTSVAQENTCAGTSPPTGESRETILVDDIERDYLQFVPSGYDGETPLPVVITMHGFTDTSQGIRDDSDFNTVAEANDFMVIYPQGLGFPPRWNNGLSQFQREDDTRDVDFLRELVHKLTDTLCVDASRIYVAGFSAGGGMAHRAACELSDLFAAAGTVSGAYSEIPGGCQPERPIAIITLHGTADPIVPYTGNDWLPDIGTWAREWAQRNTCDLTPIELESIEDISGIGYEGCADNVAVNFYSVEEGGHIWPGDTEAPALLGKASEVSGSELLWHFFSQYALPSASESHRPTDPSTSIMANS